MYSTKHNQSFAVLQFDRSFVSVCRYVSVCLSVPCAGLLCDLCGRPSIFLLLCVAFSACGQVVFTIGAGMRNLPLFYLGRFMSGTVYEITDTVPIIMMGPLFKNSWGFIVGVMNCFLRLGSVFTFLFSPHVYR